MSPLLDELLDYFDRKRLIRNDRLEIAWSWPRFDCTNFDLISICRGNEIRCSVTAQRKHELDRICTRTKGREWTRLSYRESKRRWRSKTRRLVISALEWSESEKNVIALFSLASLFSSQTMPLRMPISARPSSLQQLLRAIPKLDLCKF